MRANFLAINRIGVNSVIAILIIFTLLATIQRAFYRRSSLQAIPPIAVEVDLPSDVSLKIFKVSPKPYTEDTYQLAYMIKSLRPDLILDRRKLVDGPGGQVALGLSNAGRLELHTCLMDSGQGAVTNQRMLKENDHSTQADSSRGRILMLQGILLGRPLTSRPCLLVQLRLNEAIADTQASRAVLEERLLRRVWPILESLAPVRERELF
jgi:hypothetical protein